MKKAPELVPMSSTFCMGCVFAEYDKNNIQVGCKANRIEKFQNANIPISTIVTEDITSYIIEGKACIYYRNKDWITANYPDINNEELLSKVKSQLKIPYHAIVFYRQEDSIENIKNRLLELDQQYVKPKVVTLIDRSHREKPITSELMLLFQDYSFDYWRIQTIKTVDQTDIEIIDLVYDSTKKLSFMFYIAFESRHPIPASFSQEIHTAVQDDMKAFTVLLPNSQNVGAGALKAAHAKHAGNSFGVPLETKIIHYDDAPHLIQKVEEICPSLQMS